MSENQVKKSLFCVVSPHLPRWGMGRYKSGRNTRYFHAMASARRRMNMISKLQTLVDLCQVVASYFHNLFDENNTQTPPNLDHLTLRVMEFDNTSLLQLLSLEEFTKAIKQMHLDKAPGPDGFNPSFYQRFWPLLWNDVFQTCSTWLNMNVIP